jgi:hypothetical protein
MHVNPGKEGDIKAAIQYFREAARANVYRAAYDRYKDELFKEMTGWWRRQTAMNNQKWS